MTSCRHDSALVQEVQETVNDSSDEGVAIANLIGKDGCSVVGWVYRWETGMLAVMWGVSGPQQISETRPTLSPEQKLEIDFDGLAKIEKDDV